MLLLRLWLFESMLLLFMCRVWFLLRVLWLRVLQWLRLWFCRGQYMRLRDFLLLRWEVWLGWVV